MTLTLNSFLDAFIYALVGLSVIPLLYLNVRHARTLGLIDWPKARGVTDDHVPIVGPSLIVMALITLAVMMAFFNVSPWVLTASVIIAVMGYFDDRHPLPALDKLFFQAVCAGAVVYMDPQISSHLSSQYGNWGLFLGWFFIMAMVNAVNFIDGIDGLAGIVLLTSFAAVPFLVGASGGTYPYAILSCIMVGALVPFLYLNVIKRRGFLGNIGSYFFSFIAAVAHLSMPFEASDIVSRLCLSGLCFLIPFSDAATVITLRMASGRSPFRADKGHLHHRLVQTNLPLRYILAVFAMVQTIGAGTCFFLASSEAGKGWMVPTVIFSGLALITSTLILLLEKASRIRVQAYFQRLDLGEPIYYLKYRVSRVSKVAVTQREMLRLEAKFAAEIRVTDICVAQEADCLFVVLRTMAEPLKGISARLEAIINAEREYHFNLMERGDFAKRVTGSTPARKTA